MTCFAQKRFNVVVRGRHRARFVVVQAGEALEQAVVGTYAAVEALLREARQLGAAARADLAGADSKPDDVADLLSRAGDLVARAARDRGDGVEPSTDVPDYDDDSANDEPTDSSSEDEDDDR